MPESNWSSRWWRNCISMPKNLTHQAKFTRKMTCKICLDDDIIANQMFIIYECYHRFCNECVKRHIEVRLLEGSVIRCPYYLCKSKLTLRSCANLLTPKLREMWEQRIKEESVPVADRVYCPNPRCLALMSKTRDIGTIRWCFKCGEPFCNNCKVPWHHDLSCSDYKRLHPTPTEDDIKLKALAKKKSWRQCEKCQQMIELSHGCVKVTCRCGHRFCYKCGAKEGGCRHGLFHMYRPMSPRSQLQAYRLHQSGLPS